MSEKQSKTAEKQQRKPKNKKESEYIESLREIIRANPLTQETKAALAAFNEFLNSEEYAAFKDKVHAVSDYLTAHKEELIAAGKAEEKLAVFATFLQQELESTAEYAQYVLEDILEKYIDKEPITDKQIIRAIDRAKKRQAEFEKDRQAIETLEQAKKELQQVQYADSGKIMTSTDKFANIFFSLSAPQSKADIPGQLSFEPIPLDYESTSGKNDITLFYDYTFNEAAIKKYGLSKSFTDEAFFVASVIDNLYAEGNTTVSLTKIWHEMGNSGSPKSDALTELSKILRLGLSTIITADISDINTAWGITDDKTETTIVSAAIPVQILEKKFKANGKTANALVNITGHTPFYLIGYPINHYSTWNKDILRLYTGKRNARYYSVLRYLISNIGWLRNPKSKRSNKLTYKELYEKTGSKTSRAQQLTKATFFRLLDEVFIPTGYVKAYKEDIKKNAPGVLLEVTQNPQKITKKDKKQ